MEAPENNFEYIVSKSDWENVLAEMNQYNFSWCFVAKSPSMRFRVYVSNPSFGGLLVTKGDVIKYIKCYKK
jgi:hypothetical protein